MRRVGFCLSGPLWRFCPRRVTVARATAIEQRGKGLGGAEQLPWRAGPVARQLWQRGPGGVVLLSQARHAQTVLLALLRARGIERPVVALPAFYAESTLAPLRASSAELRFYAMTPELAPDWQQVEVQAAQAGPPHLFVLVHYYGAEGDGAAAKRFADSHGVLLFEDAAHTMLPAGGIGTFGHFACYSPRKYYGSGDGAVLVANGNAPAAELEAIAPGIPSRPAFDKFRNLKGWGDRNLPWRRRRGPLPYRDFDQDWDGAPSASSSVWMSPATSRLIERLGVPGAEAIRLREITDALTIERHVEAVTPLRGLARLPQVAPYLLGLRARNRTDAEAAYELLWAAGANVGTWPDLPQEVREFPDRYGATLELRNTILRVTPRLTDRRPALDFIKRLPVRPG